MLELRASHRIASHRMVFYAVSTSPTFLLIVRQFGCRREFFPLNPTWNVVLVVCCKLWVRDDAKQKHKNSWKNKKKKLGDVLRFMTERRQKLLKYPSIVIYKRVVQYLWKVHIVAIKWYVCAYVCVYMKACMYLCMNCFTICLKWNVRVFYDNDDCRLLSNKCMQRQFIRVVGRSHLQWTIFVCQLFI